MPTSNFHRSFFILGVLLLAGSTASAQQVDTMFGELVPFGKLQPQLDGKPLDDAELFYSERATVYLLVSPSLDQPLMIDVRSQKVDRVDASKVQRNGNGTVHLLAEAVTGEVGPFEVAQSQLKASLPGGRQLSLGPKPPLLGLHDAETLTSHDASYDYLARLYPPSEKTIGELRKETREVTVRVWFGSWCSTCARIVPWLIQVDRALEGSKIRFEYYGLPREMNDPDGVKAGVHGVPTMVVTVDGKELGRRSAPGLGVPEKALLEILGGS